MWHAQASNTFVDHTQKKLRLGDWGLGEFYFPNKIYKVSLFVLNKGCSHVLCTILVGALNPWLLSLIHSSNAKNCKQALHVLCVSFSLSHTVSIYLSHTHTHSLSLSLTHTHTHTNTHKYKYTHKHTQIQIHTHKHTHTHIHTCMCNTQVDKHKITHTRRCRQCYKLQILLQTLFLHRVSSKTLLQMYKFLTLCSTRCPRKPTRLLNCSSSTSNMVTALICGAWACILQASFSTRRRYLDVSLGLW